jgi:Uroporphyrinogen decarboxylase (URO-D)
MPVTKKLHPRDTMTAEERLQAAINLQVPDRVPVSPLIYYFAAHYMGIDNADLPYPWTWNKAIKKVFDDLGPWDAYYPLNFYALEVATSVFPMKVLVPGIDLPRDSLPQILEEEIMPFEEYEWIIKICDELPQMGQLRMCASWNTRLWEHVGEGWKSYANLLPRITFQLAKWKSEFKKWNRQGVTILYGTGVEAPFDTFSMARGILNFSRDLRKNSEIIARASDSLSESYLYTLKQMIRYLGIKRINLALHRSSNDFISPDTFRRYSLPSLKTMVERLKEEGVMCILHCDGNWDLNWEAMRELPAGCCVAQCDGSSDIFKAKEIIGDRICIYGDVPADLLALGSPGEVDEYCHRLIEEVGRGGGFILGSGCELAPNARPENVKVMMESVVKYGYYDDRKEAKPLVAVASKEAAQ